jgi:16S rRNA processing protein RimM
MAEDLLVIGRVTRPHGVRGEIRIQPFTEDETSLQRFGRLYLRNPAGRVELMDVQESRVHQDAVLLKLKGITDRDQAQAVAGSELLIRREWLPETGEDEYYWADLIGLTGYDEQGKVLGRWSTCCPPASRTCWFLTGTARRF